MLIKPFGAIRCHLSNVDIASFITALYIDLLPTIVRDIFGTVVAHVNKRLLLELLCFVTKESTSNFRPEEFFSMRAWGNRGCFATQRCIHYICLVLDDGKNCMLMSFYNNLSADKGTLRTLFLPMPRDDVVNLWHTALHTSSIDK